MEKKTAYQWCFEANIRVLDLSEWAMFTTQDAYFTVEITKEDFLKRLARVKVKPNSQPRKTDKYLEYRMYGLVPYNLSPIQQGIQYGHAVVEYGLHIEDLAEYVPTMKYDKWRRQDKTFIILNGGTTNLKPEKLGTLNKHLTSLQENNIITAEFYEPDLGDQLTAVVFLVDERVFNKEVYPDFVNSPFPWGNRMPSEKQYTAWSEENEKNKVAWIEKIGGTQNYWLREFLRPFRLA